MALRCFKLMRLMRGSYVMRHQLISSSVSLTEEVNKHNFLKKDNIKAKEFRTENDLIYLEDPDTFGTLSGKPNINVDILEDEGDIKEQEFLQNKPLQSQKLTTKQYADLMKQYLKHKRLKEAIDVLEVRMLKEDKVKPNNYLYNILIGACAEVGYTKKAFKLFNDMKRRALRPTGDTYTCLFQACTNSPWPIDGLKNAHKLRELMIEKQIEPNLTNYNAMIKAFGRCGDLPTAFKIVDEMISKKIKIRVHTFNHLLHACISDKSTGLRHALVVWRKMLKMKEKPNLYSFNLMLKCVKDCNLGTKEDIEELVAIIQDNILIENTKVKPLQIESSKKKLNKEQEIKLLNESQADTRTQVDDTKINDDVKLEYNDKLENSNELSTIDNKDKITIQIMDKVVKPTEIEDRRVPNLLSRSLKMQQVLALQEVDTPYDRFAIIGGQEDFLKEMNSYSIKPDIKTFTQMLPLIEDTREAEIQLLDELKSSDIKADIDFYNMLIKKRCLRSDYDGAFEVKDMIGEESKHRKKHYPFKKKLKLNMNIMSYGVLAMACKTKEQAEKLLNEMKEMQLKVNIEILGTLLRQGTAQNSYGYLVYVMNQVKEQNVRVNETFIKHIEAFNDKCTQYIQDSKDKYKNMDSFEKNYKRFLDFYNRWLNEINVEEALKPEHPWAQFKEEQPETLQRSNVEIVEPKKFYNRNRRFIKYNPLVK